MAISRFKTSTLAQGLPKYQDVWDGISAVFDSDYELITRTTVGAGGSSAITFTSIPNTYKHLQIRGIALGSAAASGSLQCQINSDTSANYSRHELGGNGATVSIYAATGATSVNMYGYYDNPSNSGYPVAFIMDIPDYANTNKYKTVRVLSGMDKNATNYGEVFLKGSLWKSSSAVSSLSIFIGGQNLAQYSSFGLYGIR